MFYLAAAQAVGRGKGLAREGFLEAGRVRSSAILANRYLRLTRFTRATLASANPIRSASGVVVENTGSAGANVIVRADSGPRAKAGGHGKSEYHVVHIFLLGENLPLPVRLEVRAEYAGFGAGCFCGAVVGLREQG